MKILYEKGGYVVPFVCLKIINGNVEFEYLYTQSINNIHENISIRFVLQVT